MAAFLFKQEVFKTDAHIEKVLKKLLMVACDVILVKSNYIQFLRVFSHMVICTRLTDHYHTLNPQ